MFAGRTSVLMRPTRRGREEEERTGWYWQSGALVWDLVWDQQVSLRLALQSTRGRRTKRVKGQIQCDFSLRWTDSDLTFLCSLFKSDSLGVCDWSVDDWDGTELFCQLFSLLINQLFLVSVNSHWNVPSNFRSSVAYANKEVVGGRRAPRCSGVRTVLGSVVGAGDSQYLASELEGDELRWYVKTSGRLIGFSPDQVWDSGSITGFNNQSHEVLTNGLKNVRVEATTRTVWRCLQDSLSSVWLPGSVVSSDLWLLRNRELFLLLYFSPAARREVGSDLRIAELPRSSKRHSDMKPLKCPDWGSRACREATLEFFFEVWQQDLRANRSRPF